MTDSDILCMMTEIIGCQNALLMTLYISESSSVLAEHSTNLTMTPLAAMSAKVNLFLRVSRYLCLALSSSMRWAFLTFRISSISLSSSLSTSVAFFANCRSYLLQATMMGVFWDRMVRLLRIS